MRKEPFLFTLVVSGQLIINSSSHLKMILVCDRNACVNVLAFVYLLYAMAGGTDLIRPKWAKKTTTLQ